MTTLEKIIYLEKKFNAPMDIIMQVITECKKNNISVEEVEIITK
jgi:hypothetical protein